MNDWILWTVAVIIGVAAITLGYFGVTTDKPVPEPEDSTPEVRDSMCAKVEQANGAAVAEHFAKCETCQKAMNGESDTGICEKGAELAMGGKWSRFCFHCTTCPKNYGDGHWCQTAKHPSELCPKGLELYQEVEIKPE